MSAATKKSTDQATLAPVIREIGISCSTKRAFELFTQDVAKWWPLGDHSLSSKICNAPARTCAFEPYEDGAFYEIMADGVRQPWGRVLVWAPGERLVFSWHVGRDPAQSTEVEISFAPTKEGGARVTLEHRNWEMLGDEAAKQQQGYSTGWVTVFDQGFGNYAVQAE